MFQGGLEGVHSFMKGAFNHCIMLIIFHSKTSVVILQVEGVLCTRLWYFVIKPAYIPDAYMYKRKQSSFFLKCLFCQIDYIHYRGK